MHRTGRIANSLGEHREHGGELPEYAEEHSEPVRDDPERSGIDGEELGEVLDASGTCDNGLDSTCRGLHLYVCGPLRLPAQQA